MPRICRVLVVEDHDGVRTLLGEALADDGYRFTLLSSGAEMRAALDADDFDIVIIDVSLRREDGFALAAEAAECGVGIVLTSSDEHQIERMRSSGHRFIQKPFLMPTLIAMVEEVRRETASRCIKRKRQDASLRS